MELRVPGGSWFDWLVQTAPDTAVGAHATGEPTTGDLDAAIDAMRAGNIEFVILEDTDGTFVQAAGEGDRGYQLEHWANGTQVAARTDASVDDVRAAMTAYLHGERPAAGPPTETPPAKRRWFGRR